MVYIQKALAVVTTLKRTTAHLRRLYLPQLVDVLALAALSSDVGVGADLAASDPGQVRLDIESEGAEFFHIHALALAQVVVKISD
jgi:hypothetical protein